MASTPGTQRDIAAGKNDRNQAALTAEDAHVLVGDTYTLADEGGVIIANRTRIGEIEAALQRAGIVV